MLIVTPPQTHKELAIKAIQQGFHVMMEKPLAHTLEEAKELLDFKQNHHKQLMVSQNYRWNRPIQTVKQLLDAGEIGKVEWMNYSFQRASHFGGWRDRYDHILLEDMSIHHFDLMRYLLNKNPVEVYAQSYRPSWSWFQGNPNAHVSIAFEDDVHVSYAGSWVTKGKETPWNGEFRLVGEKGAIELIEDKVTLYDSNNEARNVPIVNLPYDDRTLSLDHFVQSIIIGNQVATSIEDNIKSYELTCAAIESAVTHKVVKPLYPWSKTDYRLKEGYGMAKKLSVFIILLALFLVLPACESAEGKQDGKIKLTWWDYYGSEAAVAMNNAIKTYEKAHPNVDIERIEVPFGELKEDTLRSKWRGIAGHSDH